MPDGVKMLGEPSDSELMDIAHEAGSSWDQCCMEGERNIMPDNITKVCFETIME